MEPLELLYSCAVTSTCFERAWNNRDFVELWNVKRNFELTRQSGCSDKQKESLLLNLTVIQKLFERIPVVNCWYLVKVCSDDASLCNLMGGLIACLGSTYQHVAFSAAKTIVVAVRALSKQLITLDCLEMLFDFSDSGPQSWKHLYTLNALREIIRSCREPPQQFPEHARSCSCRDHQTESEDLRLSSMKLADWCLSRFNVLHVFFHCVPFIVRPNCMYSFVESCSSNDTTEDFSLLQACLKLGHLIHEQENTMCAISKNQVHTFNAFLQLLSEMAKYLQGRAAKHDPLPNSKTLLNFSENDVKHSISDSCVTGQLSAVPGSAAVMEKEPPSDYSVHGWMLLCNRSTKEREICNVAVLLVQCLHFKRLQPLIYKNILEVLNQVLTLPISTFKSSYKPGCVKLNRIQRHSAIAVLSIADCCLLSNTPRCFGFVGFGGTEVRCSPGVISDELQDSVDLVALRKATLLLLKSCFILLETAMGQEGSSVVQNLCFHCVGRWNKGLLSLAPEVLSASKVYSPEYGGNELCLFYTALFSDQDDELIDALLLLLLLFQKIGRICDEIQANILHQLNPHWLFASFAESINFDHSVLLDFLISSETRFLEYILHYLHFLLIDWEQFVERVATYSGDQPLMARESATKGIAVDCETHVEVARYSFKGSDKFEFCDAELSNSGESEVSKPHMVGGEDLSTNPSARLKINPIEPVHNEELPPCIAPDSSENRGFDGNTRANIFSRHIDPGDFESGRLRILEGKLNEASGLAAIASAYCSSDDSSVDDNDEIERTRRITSLLGGEPASVKDENLVPSNWKNSFFSLAVENQAVEGETFFACLRGSECGRRSDPLWTKDANRCGNSLAETNRFALFQKFTESSVSSRTEVCLDNNKRLSYETELPISKDDIFGSAEADPRGDMSTHLDDVPFGSGEPQHIAGNTEPRDAPEVPGVTFWEELGCCYGSRILDRIMSMLIRLRIAVERLSGEKYFPYSAIPLLKLLERVEMCYDGC